VKFLLSAAALLAAVNLHTEEPGKDVVCATWAQNALIGGEHAWMGHSRKLVPLQHEDIVELIEHGQLLKIDGIPVFAQEHATPEGQAFLEGSVFYGFDYVKRTPTEQLPATAQQMLEIFVQVCRADDRLVSR
jgi:hypothetical protein